MCAASHVMNSFRQVGSGDTTHILVRLLASKGEQPGSCLCLTNAQVAEIEDSGQALTKEHEVTRLLLLPVLRAQSTGERRFKSFWTNIFLKLNFFDIENENDEVDIGAKAHPRECQSRVVGFDVGVVLRSDRNITTMCLTMRLTPRFTERRMSVNGRNGDPGRVWAPWSVLVDGWREPKTNQSG